VPRSFSIEFIDLSARHRATDDTDDNTDERIARAEEATSQSSVSRAGVVPSERRPRLFLSERERS
jgi:hypothetical protein